MARAQSPALIADVIDRAAEHQAERLVAGVLEQQVLVDGQVGGEQPGLGVLEPGAGGLIELHRAHAPRPRTARGCSAPARVRRTAEPQAWTVIVIPSRLRLLEPSESARSTPITPSAFSARASASSRSIASRRAS